MIELDGFLPVIMPHVAGCPEPTAFGKIIEAAQEFCERTRLWRDEDTFTLSADGCNIPCAPVGATVFQIEAAFVDEQQLEPISYPELNRQSPDWRNQDGQARYISQALPGSVVVAPGKAEGKLRLVTLLRPADDADMLPDFLLTEYRQAIADGALARLLMIPTQSFSDPERAAYFAMRFESKLNALFAQNVKGQQRAPARTKARYF